MAYEIEIPTSVIVESNNTAVIELDNPTADIIDNQDRSVDVYSCTYVVVCDDIYIKNYIAEIPAWMQTYIENITNTALASTNTTLSNLLSNFSALQDGYTATIASVTSDIATQNATITSLVTSTDTAIAGINTTLNTKIDQTQALALIAQEIATFRDFGLTEASAWWQAIINTVVTEQQAQATNISTLTSGMNNNSSSVSTLQSAVTTLDSAVAKASQYVTATVGGTTLITGYALVSSIDPQGEQISSVVFNAADFRLYTTTTLPNDTATPIFQVTGSEVNFNGTVSINKLASAIHIGIYATPPVSPVTLGGVSYTIKDGDTYTNSTDGIIYIMSGVWTTTQGADGANGSNGADGIRGTVSVFKTFTAIPTDTELNNAIYAVVDPDTLLSGDNVIYTISSGVDAGTKQAYYNGVSWVKEVALYVNGDAVIDGTLSATKLNATEAWINGFVQSSDFVGYTTGFRLKSNAAGTFADPTIYGAYIRGGTLDSLVLNAATINIRTLNLINDADKSVLAVFTAQKWADTISIAGTVTTQRLYFGFYTWDSLGSSPRRTVGVTGSIISFTNPGTQIAELKHQDWIHLHAADSVDYTSIDVSVMVGSTVLASKTGSWTVNTEYNVGGFILKVDYDASRTYKWALKLRVWSDDISVSSGSTEQVSLKIVTTSSATTRSAYSSGLDMLMSNM